MQCTCGDSVALREARSGSRVLLYRECPGCKRVGGERLTDRASGEVLAHGTEARKAYQEAQR